MYDKFNINIEKLRSELYDYFGVAMIYSSEVAMLELEKIEKASAQELIKIAEKYGFDLEKYTTSKSR